MNLCSFFIQRIQNIIFPRATDTLLGNAKGENVCRTIGKLIEVKIKSLTITRLEKVSTIIDPVNNGQIIIVSDLEDSKKAIDEILDFQGQTYSVHDDAPDNLSEIENKLKEIKTRTILKVGNISNLYRQGV